MRLLAISSGRALSGITARPKNPFEDAIQNAISIGGDSDTIAAICGAVARAYYGVPEDIREKAERFLDPCLLETLYAFEREAGMSR